MGQVCKRGRREDQAPSRSHHLVETQHIVRVSEESGLPVVFFPLLVFLRNTKKKLGFSSGLEAKRGWSGLTKALNIITE